MTADLLHGDVLEMLATLPDNSFDGLLSDPPYGIGFMGKQWDHGVPSAAVWRECLRVLKPGAPLLAFGGTRTYHRLTCAIEDAGFEIRDCMMWLYGSGFPKSLDVSKALDKAAGAVREVVGMSSRPDGTDRKYDGWQSTPSYGGHGVDRSVTAPSTAAAQAWSGYGTALKPAWESIILARKPLDGTVAQNVTKWGVGALAIDASRIEAQGRSLIQSLSRESVSTFGDGLNGSKAAGSTDLGRWPANVILDEEAGAVLDEQTGNRPGMSGGGKHKPGYQGGMFGGIDSTATARGDSGGASRFFYCPKASKAERERGCEGLPIKSAGECTDREDGSAGLNSPRAGAGRTAGNRNNHPCVKPQALIRYLARLILPPNPGTLLVPYSGSGSEVMGALAAGWPKVVGIELESDYIAIARARIGKAA